MRILVLATAVPHAKVVSGLTIVHHRIRLLAERGHQVGLVCFAEPGESALAGEIAPHLVDLRMAPRPRPRRRPLRLLHYLLDPIPYDFRALRSATMQQMVGAALLAGRYDIALAEFSEMGQYFHQNPYLPAVRRVISTHGSFSTAYRKARELQAWSTKSVRKALRMHGVAGYERQIYRSADLVLTLTPQGRQNLLSLAPDLDVGVVPYGVDTSHFRPQPPDAEPSIVYTGLFSQEPNEDAALWFARTAWPLLRARHPALKLYLVGRDPTKAMRRLARRDPQIFVTGEVDDVAPYLARARAFVCPTRLGSGFQGKLLQAMAMGIPVVCTSVAAEGIPAHAGHNLMLADTVEGLAQALDLVLIDPGLRERLALHARELVLSRYDWTACVDRLEQVLGELIARR